MSRVYRISVSESLRRHIKVDDGVQTNLELLAVLPEQRMAELLAEELEELGFTIDGDVARRVDEDGVEVTVELNSGAVTARLSAEADLDLEAKAQGTTGGNQEAARQRLSEQVQRRLERQADARQEEMRREVTEKLEQKLRDLRKELDGAVNRATAEALKEKAAQLGEIQEIAEDEETGEIAIRVRV